MAHSFDPRMRKALDEETKNVNPTLLNYVRLLTKIGKLERRVKFNRIMVVINTLIFLVLLITELDPHIHV